MVTRYLAIAVLCGCGTASAPPSPTRAEVRPATPPERATAPQVSGGPLGNAIDVAVAQGHACALLASGKVACWGELSGSLDPLVTSPVLVDKVDGAVAISAGDCVLRKQGPAMCWRVTMSGITDVREVPGTEGALDMSDGGLCFVLANRTVACVDERGRLAPVTGMTDVRAIDEWAYNELCALRVDGQVICSHPVDEDLGKLPMHRDAIDVVRVDQSTLCVVREGGVLSCSGRADQTPPRGDQIFLQSGRASCLRTGGVVKCRDRGDAAWSDKPVGGAATDLGCDSNACCAVVGGTVSCWGNNEQGRLGDGMPSGARSPTKVDGLPPTRVIAAGSGFTMALAQDGALYAWGQFGDGPRVPKQIATGPATLLAVADVGGVVADKRQVRMVLPDDDRWRLETLPSVPADALSIARSDRDICAALADGTTRCLTQDDDGNVGWTKLANMTGVTQLSGGGAICGVGNGKVSCRARNGVRLVPTITNATRLAIPFVELATGDVVKIEIDEDDKWHIDRLVDLAGIGHLETGGYQWSPTCGLKGKQAYCWSATGGTEDRLGILAREPASTIAPKVPAPVAGAHPTIAVTAGNKHACLLDEAGAVWCWGDDRQGELGRGRISYRVEAGRVVNIGP